MESNVTNETFPNTTSQPVTAATSYTSLITNEPRLLLLGFIYAIILICVTITLLTSFITHRLQKMKLRSNITGALEQKILTLTSYPQTVTLLKLLQL